MSKDIKNGTWEFLKENKLWHFDKELNSSNYKIIGRFIGNWQNEINQLDFDQLKKIENTMSHKTKDSYYNDIEEGNKKDFIKYGFPENLEYGYVNDKKSKPTETLPDVFIKMFNKIPLLNAYPKFTKQMPGQLWPMHFDNYHALRPNLSEKTWEDPNIRRIWIALNDWDWGHCVLFGNTPWTGWRAGDILYFDWLIPHGTANCGNTPRFSMFVTGFMTEEMKNWIQNEEFREIVL